MPRTCRAGGNFKSGVAWIWEVGGLLFPWLLSVHRFSLGRVMWYGYPTAAVVVVANSQPFASVVPRLDSTFVAFSADGDPKKKKMCAKKSDICSLSYVYLFGWW